MVQTYDERWAPAGLAQYGIDPDGVAIRLDWSAQELSAARLTSMEDWSPDGKRVLASSGDDPGFFVIDLEHGTRRKLLDAYEPETLQAAAWLPDGKRFLIKVAKSGAVSGIAAHFRGKKLKDLGQSELDAAARTALRLAGAPSVADGASARRCGRARWVLHSLCSRRAARPPRK